MGSPPPSQGEVGRKYSILGRKFWSEKIDTWWRLLASRLDETPGRELKHQYLQYKIEHFLGSCTRARRQEKYEIMQFLLFFSVFRLSCFSARRHEEFENHSFPIVFIVFLFSCIGHENRKSTKVIHFLFLFSISDFLAQGLWTLGFGRWALDFGFWTLDLGCWL